jgi:putative salt-induced outer membrane protein YdiY
MHMKRATRAAIAIALGAAVSLAADAATAQAQDEKEFGWFFTAEVTGVWASGNSESTTLGLAATGRRVWDNSELKIDGGAVRTESSTTRRTAVGTIDDFVVEKETTRRKTAENYYLRGRFDYKLSERFFTFAGADWLRNTFAGIDSRLLFAIGAGNIWLDDDRFRFRTDYSTTYTFQEDVVENPFTKTGFPGLRLSYGFWWDLTSSTDLESSLTADWNLDNTDDLRLDFTNSLPISISEALAFKPSLQLLWRNEPSLTQVALEDQSGVPTGDTVLVPLEKLDTFFTLALVVRL